MDARSTSRRELLRVAAGGGAGLVLAGCGPREEPHEEEISPAEDLMREHGVLNRILLVYEEALRRLDAGEDLPPQSLLESAEIIRRFIEDYHEKLEEDHLFPRFERAGRLVDLVKVLREQHLAGRRLTDAIRGRATAAAVRDADEARRLSGSLRAFVRMYRPHEAREDTVLFPALREIVTPSEYDALGEDFERQEHVLFGENGFEAVVADVERIETYLGIQDLSRFTAK